MPEQAPRNVFEVRREANARMSEHVLGYRGVQIVTVFEERRKLGLPDPSLGDLKRELDFYDKAGALRALRRVLQRGAIKNNPSR